ncbi:MAG TPA: hypothetical protein VFX92_00355 [Candidatus Krumholzibacteria bacterium]|nr:hypothetical protein [Candidatus Krumholzibacteria bacterium]
MAGVVACLWAHDANASRTSDGEDPLLSSHIVVEAVIASVDNEVIDKDDYERFYRSWTLEQNPTFVNLTLQDVKVLRGGDYGPATVMAAEVPMRRLVGRRVVLCAYWNEGLARYIVPFDECVLSSDATMWVRLDGESLSDSELQAKVDGANPRSMTHRAVVVAEGRVRAVRERLVGVVDFPKKIYMKAVELEDVTYFKGAGVETLLTFEVITRGRGYSPSWRAPVPERIAPGERWIVFLGRDEKNGFLYPLSGKNGMLRVDGDRLMLDNRVNYRFSARELRDAATAEVGN